MRQDDKNDEEDGFLSAGDSHSNPSSTTICAGTTSFPPKHISDLSFLFAALHQKCSVSGSIALAAIMMMNRWSLALGCPGGVPVAMMSRKAALQQQVSPSQTLRAEIEMELLGSDGAVSSEATSPYMYSIPLLRLSPKLAPTAGAGARVEDTPQLHQPRSRHFSDSRRYMDSRTFYARQNAEAFESIVPYGVTTNTFIVDAYVRCILAYLEDVRHHYDDGRSSGNKGSDSTTLPTNTSKKKGSDDFDPISSTRTSTTPDGNSQLKTKVYIIELAAGHCLFGYLLAKRLLQAQEEGVLPPSFCSSICVLLTDFNKTLLENRMNTPWMQPLVAAGLVEFAVLDAASSSSQGIHGKGGTKAQPLVLLGKEVTMLEPESLKGPVFVVGNYALDSFPVDIFMQTKTQGLMEVREEEETGRLTLVSSSVGTLEEEGEEKAYPYHNILQALVGRGEEGVLHVVNVGLIRLLERIRGLLHPHHKGDLALLLADGTFQYDDPTWRVQVVPGEEIEGAQGEEEVENEDEKGKRQVQQQQQRQQREEQVPEGECAAVSQDPHIQHLQLQYEHGRQHSKVKPSFRKRKRKLTISLPDMSPGPGSGCFALAMDPQAVVTAALWALGVKEEEGREGVGEGEKWLAVRNTVVEGSLTATLFAQVEDRKHEEEGGGEDWPLPCTREAFWRHVCLQNPTDFEHLQGLILEEHNRDGYDSSGESLLACLGLDGMLALLRWSGYDGDLFFALRWPLRNAILRCRRLASADGHKTKIDVGADYKEVALRCLSNRMVLSTRAWNRTRYWGEQFLFALGCYRETVAFFLHDTSGCVGPISLSSASTLELWKDEYSGRFGSSAEAFLVTMSLKNVVHTENAELTAHHVLVGVMEGQRFLDGKGRRRIENYLKRDQCLLRRDKSN